MTKHRVLLTITGARVSPEEVSLGELVDVLSRVDRAVSSYVLAKELDLPEGAKMSLVDIESGSEQLVFAVSEPLVPVVAGISKAISDGEFDDLPRETHRELYELSGSMSKKSWSLEFRADEKRGIYSASLGASFEVPKPRGPVNLQGTTTIHARCLRVGGVQPKAELRLANREKLLHADLTEDVAKQLAQRLYEEVILEGRATWNADTWEVEAFRVNRVTAYRKTDAVLAFKELAEAARGTWDEVDASSYVQDLRSDG